eukprot:4840009-Pyramimonas_sp.AAC.1
MACVLVCCAAAMSTDALCTLRLVPRVLICNVVASGAIAVDLVAGGCGDEGYFTLGDVVHPCFDCARAG